MSKGLYFLGFVFCLTLLLGSCSNSNGTLNGKSRIVRIDTVNVNYGGTVSKSFSN